MALLNCPECKERVSDQAEACPHCGFPLLKIDYTFADVWFNGSWMEGEVRLKELLNNGWQVVDQHEVVEWEEGHSIDIMKYKLQKKVRNNQA